MLSSCGKEKIYITAYILFINGSNTYVTELPCEGIKIIINTIGKMIHITLQGVVGNYGVKGVIAPHYFPFYILQTLSADYVIDSLEYKSDGIVLRTRYENEQFRCVFDDNFLMCVVWKYQ